MPQFLTKKIAGIPVFVYLLAFAAGAWWWGRRAQAGEEEEEVADDYLADEEVLPVRAVSGIAYDEYPFPQEPAPPPTGGGIPGISPDAKIDIKARIAALVQEKKKLAQQIKNLAADIKKAKPKKKAKLRIKRQQLIRRRAWIIAQTNYLKLLLKTYGAAAS